MPNTKSLHAFPQCFFNAADGCLYLICHKEPSCFLLCSFCIEDRNTYNIAEFGTLDEAVHAYHEMKTESCIELHVDDAPSKVACFRRLAYYYFRKLAYRLDLNPDHIKDTRRYNIYKQINKFKYVEQKMIEYNNIPHSLVITYYRYLHRTFMDDLTDGRFLPEKNDGKTEIDLE